MVNALATGSEDRLISLGPDTAMVPERLLLAHAKGKVLFIAGAGISRPSGCPDFRRLVLDIYAKCDASVHSVLSGIPDDACNKWPAVASGLNSEQLAEIRRFVTGEYDVVLGMLERRMEGIGTPATNVRHLIREILIGHRKPAAIHHSLVRLAYRGAAMTIATTNFDLLLESAARAQKRSTQTSTLGGIPRAGHGPDFRGVLHIHGALSRRSNETHPLIVSDQDFGEFYLRRRIIPDFVYDAARLFNIVFVGYSANDAPMRYLLNAISADGSRFEDVKERFVFVSGTEVADPISVADWKARGITPIPYSSKDNHAALNATLAKWAELSAIIGQRKLIYAEVKRIVKKTRKNVDERERDLFDHLYRRADRNERSKIAELVTKTLASLDWADAMAVIDKEPVKGASDGP